MKKNIFIFIIIAFAVRLFGAVSAPERILPEFDGNSIKLTWTISNTAGLNNFAICRSTEPLLNNTQWDDFAINTMVASSVRTYTDALPNTTLAYIYRVKSYTNVLSDGAYSITVGAAPYPDLSIVASNYDSKVILNWQNSPSQNISGYNIYRSTVPSIFDALQVGSTAGNIFIDYSAVNLINYHYTIRPVSSFEGSFSTMVNALPFAAPFVPSGIAVTVTGNTAEITWSTKTARASYDIMGYNIYRSNTNVSDSDFLAFTLTAYYNDSTLTQGTNYQYRIRAVDVNSNISLPYDFSLYCPGLPSAPQGVVVSANSITATVVWNANKSNENIINYHVYRDAVEIGTTTSLFYNDWTVNSATSYSYVIRGENSFGIGAASAAVPVMIIPSAPLGVVLSRGIIPGTLSLSWQTSPAFENVTGYNVYRAASLPIFSVPSVVTLTAINDTAINTGEVYYYRISAFGTIEGAYSLTVSAMPVTYTPMIQNITATAYNNYSFLQWDTLPSGYDVTGYNIYKSISNSASESYVFVTQTASNYYTVSGLTASLNYYFKIAALNSYGAGDTINASYTYITLSAAAPPREPENLRVSSQGDGKINLTWNPGTNGSGITSYNVYRSQIPGSYAAPCAIVNTTSYTDATYTVAAGTNYYYIIKAEASGVESIASAEGNTKPFYRPYPVLNKGASYVNKSSVLIWTKPNQLGTFQTVNKYRIYRSTSAISGFTNIQDSITQEYYIDNNINTATSVYYYKIKNYDDLNYEDNDQTVESVAVSSVQAPPATLIAVAGDSNATLIWRITTPQYYNLYRREASNPTYGAPVAYNISFATKEYVDTGLINGTTYIYMIKAVNSAGEGPPSNEAVVLPYVAVSMPVDNSVIVSIANKKDVYISWAAATGGVLPCTLSGYYVMRSSDGGGTYTQVTITSLTNYTDTSTEWNKTYYYLVKTLDTCGNSDGLYNPGKITLAKPVSKIRVYKNLLNLELGVPLRLRYVLIKGGQIKFRIYTISGDFVTELIDTNITGLVDSDNPFESADFYWNGKNIHNETVSSGIYILSLETKTERVIEKVAVVK